MHQVEQQTTATRALRRRHGGSAEFAVIGMTSALATLSLPLITPLPLEGVLTNHSFEHPWLACALLLAALVARRAAPASH